MTLRRLLVVLGALALVRLALMALVPVFEPSEARYAAISANMARSGDFVVPRFTHNLEYQSFDGKPPLVFQAGGVFCRLFGTTRPETLQFGVRLFPFLSAVLMLLLVGHAVTRFADAPTGRLAMAMTATATAFYAASGIAMTDMTLTCCVAGALLMYACFMDAERRCQRGAAWGYALVVSALLGAGMIVKGPVAWVLFGLPVFVDACVNRHWKYVFNVHWLVVSPLLLLIAVPWFVLVERVNAGSVWYFFYNENFMRFISHDYGDKYGAGREAFRGVSVVWAFVATLPWALVPLVRFVRQVAHGSFRTALGAVKWKSFTLLAVLSIVGFWCLTSRVLLYYLFPVIPLVMAHLATSGDRSLLCRLVVPSAVLSLAVVAGTLTAGSFYSEKMRGAATEFSIWSNHYAHEFYHGRKSEAELQACRAQREEGLRRLRERAARNAAQKPPITK